MMSFFIPFVSIMLAEFGDKTMLAVLLLASKTKRHGMLWAGVMLAFILVDGTAILLGAAAPRFFPVAAVKIISGLLFITGGILILRSKHEEDHVEKSKLKNPFLLGFAMIFTAEWGDKTQIAAGLFAARFPIVPVFAGTVCALGVLSSVSIFAGHWLSTRVSGAKLQKIAAVIFIIMGISCFLI